MEENFSLIMNDNPFCRFKCYSYHDPDGYVWTDTEWFDPADVYDFETVFKIYETTASYEPKYAIAFQFNEELRQWEFSYIVEVN